MSTAHTCAVCHAPLPPHLVGDLPAPERLHAGVHLLCDRQECRDSLDAEDTAAESRPRTLNARRIDAANALTDADAHLRALLARWADPTDADPALSAKIDAAKVARADAQRALNDAEQEWSAAVTAERIEAEDAARA